MQSEYGPRSGEIWQGEPDLGGWYTEEEVEALVKSVRDSMDWTRGFIPHDELRAFEEQFASYVGANFALAINGAGTGLDMIMRSLNLEPGDEVISGALNFPGSHLAVIGQGGRLVLAEPDPMTLNICPNDVERKISARTRAILVTHVSGLSADMDAIDEIARRNGRGRYGPPKIIVDAARACGASYKGKRVGSQGWATVFSFQRKKLMTTLGEGGMIVCDDPELRSKLDAMRSFGMGLSWGTNYKMTKPQAAVGRVQLRRLDSMNAQRIERANERTSILRHRTRSVLPYTPDNATHMYYLYCVILPPEFRDIGRNRVIQLMRERYRLEAKVVNAPTYTKNELILSHVQGQKTPLADELGGRVICLPLHPLMTKEQNEYVSEAFLEAIRLQGVN